MTETALVPFDESPQATQPAPSLSDRELLGIVQREIDSCIGMSGSRLEVARRRNLREYLGNPRGDERDGRSQVIARDTFEQVEWLMPALMEIFTSGPEIARFQPHGPEDEQEAEQKTDTVNYFFRLCEGFMVLYTMFKDALIQKAGIVKIWWEENEEATHEEYHGKTLFEVMGLEQDPNFVFRGVAAYLEPEGPQGQRLALDLSAGLPQGVPPEEILFDVTGVRVNATGRPVIENIPPEEFYINRDARSLSHPSCRFVAHRVRTTVSRLISLGYDRDTVMNLPSSNSSFTADLDVLVRGSQDDANPLDISARSDSEKPVTINDCYVLVDQDGDGISEWWHVVAGGDYGETLLSVEPADGHPFAAVTPIPIPHRFYGLAVADVTSDLQNINGTLWRQILDSSYLATDPRTIVFSQGSGDAAMPMANLDQLLDASPGGYIEEYVQGAIRPFETRSNLAELLPALELHDKMKVARTGISPDALGINPQAISKHVYGAMVQQSAAQQRVILYARIFAETGVKRIFELLAGLIAKNQTRSMQIRLRGEWVPVDPSQWKRQMDCIVTVGLGHGSKMEKAANAEALAAIQEKLIQGGYEWMVTPENIYNTVVTIAEARGFRDAAKFVTDPSRVEPPPPQPDPAVLAIQAQQQIDMFKAELDRQRLEIERDKILLEVKKAELEHEVEIAKIRAAGGSPPMDDPWTLRPPRGGNVAGPMGVAQTRPPGWVDGAVKEAQLTLTEARADGRI